VLIERAWEEFNPDLEDLRALVRQGESETVELKARLPSEQVIAQTLVAFANTSGGILIIGADESRPPESRLIGLRAGEGERAMERVAGVLRSVPVRRGHGIADLGEFGESVIVYAYVRPAPEHLRPITTADGIAYVRAATKTLEEELSREVPVGREVTLFVAMSFRSEEEPALIDYFRAIERAVERSDIPIRVVRIDLQEGDYEISQEIMDVIAKSDIVLADFTLSPQNVYFELGFARGSGKRVIQTARADTRLEFDVRNWRTVIYRNATELEEKLLPALSAAYSDAV
jgi:Schlafen, AlbA_2